jgi:hypothetical protein
MHEHVTGRLPHLRFDMSQVLIADFFFVCLSLVALVIATGVQTVSKSTVRSRLPGCAHDWRSILLMHPTTMLAPVSALLHWLAGVVKSMASGLAGVVSASNRRPDGWRGEVLHVCMLLVSYFSPKYRLLVFKGVLALLSQLLSGLIGWVQSDIIKD